MLFDELDELTDICAFMQVILFDTTDRNTLYPFTAIRPVAEIRTGIFTIRERWQHILQAETFTLTEDYLQAKFPSGNSGDQLYIDAKLIPTKDWQTVSNRWQLAKALPAMAESLRFAQLISFHLVFQQLIALPFNFLNGRKRFSCSSILFRSHNGMIQPFEVIFHKSPLKEYHNSFQQLIVLHHPIRYLLKKVQWLSIAF
ncbi:MAG: hypothetical protein IPK31_17995 [Chitinophagaceae bacterium]|nr:hypothetical protein [Chitinophagaceae bacterium]